MADSKAFETESKRMANKRICWCCGEESNECENHHAIPVALKPKKNKTVRVCHECHDKINMFYVKQYGGKNQDENNIHISGM